MTPEQLEMFDVRESGQHQVFDTLPDLIGEPPAMNVPTSIQSADRIKKLPKTKLAEAVLHRWLVERGQYGATDDEIQEHFGWDGDYERPRRWALMKRETNYIYRSELKRKTRDGNPAIVWKAV